jgi:hypothetical protein
MWHSRLRIYIPWGAAEGNIYHKPGMIFNHCFFSIQHPTVINKFASFIFIFCISRCLFPYLWRHSSMMSKYVSRRSTMFVMDLFRNLIGWWVNVCYYHRDWSIQIFKNMDAEHVQYNFRGILQWIFDQHCSLIREDKYKYQISK